MSKRRKVALIVLVWIAAACLCALPSLWPAYGRLIRTGVYQYYETLTLGVLLGWWTGDVLGRRGGKVVKS